MQMNLFQNITACDTDGYAPEIRGMTLKNDFITLQEELDLIKLIDSQNWLHDLKRRVQHYGYKYDYKSKKRAVENKLGELPDWLNIYCEKLYKLGLFDTYPDQVIINEYLPGQGISKHIDCISCFGNKIVSISLGSDCVMDFSNNIEGKVVPFLLKRRSLLSLTDEARYKWMHGIAARKTDKFNELYFKRERRVSITFRKVLQE